MSTFPDQKILPVFARYSRGEVSARLYSQKPGQAGGVGRSSPGVWAIHRLDGRRAQERVSVRGWSRWAGRRVAVHIRFGLCSICETSLWLYT